MHGLRTTYVKGCRCADCRDANRKYNNQLERKKTLIRWGQIEPDLIDSTGVREHLERLRESGMGRRRIVELSGVSSTIISRLIGLDKSKPATRVYRSTAAKILAVEPGNVAAGQNVRATGTHRRLKALARMGWSLGFIGESTGIGAGNISTIMRNEFVTQKTADRIAKLYSELELYPGPSNLTASRAKNLGWLPPAAWDDPDCDPEPVESYDKEIVDEVKIELFREGQPVVLTRAERRRAFQLWQGVLLQSHIQKLLGLSGQTYLKWREELSDNVE